MARETTKTNPIGVRFDKDLLEGLNLGGIADTPQKALNLYEKSYIELIEIKTRLFKSAEIIEVIEEVKNEKPKENASIPEAGTKLTIRQQIELEKSKLNSKK